MKLIQPYDAAFPDMPVQREENANAEPSGAYSDPGGLTKREWFAAMALQGLVTRWNDMSQTHSKICSEQAVEYADALIEALNAKAIADNTAERLAIK